MRLTGFTLLEVLLSVALMSLIAGMAIPLTLNLQIRNDLDVTANDISQSLRRAQTLAVAMDGDVNWGVNVQRGTITLFQGASFAARNSAWDEVFAIPSTITPSGSATILFTKFTGNATPTAGSITLTSLRNETRSISVNAKGMVTD